MWNTASVEPCGAQRFVYSCKPLVKYEIKHQLLRVDYSFRMLRLSPLFLDWNAICFLSGKKYERRKKKKDKNGELEVCSLLECKCAPGWGFASRYQLTSQGESHCCDSFRETWHLGDNRSVLLQLFFNFSAVWNLHTLFQRLSELHNTLCPVLWQGFAERRENCGIWASDSDPYESGLNFKCTECGSSAVFVLCLYFWNEEAYNIIKPPKIS